MRRRNVQNRDTEEVVNEVLKSSQSHENKNEEKKKDLEALQIQLVKKNSILREIPLFMEIIRTFELFLKIDDPDAPMLDVEILEENYKKVALHIACLWAFLTSFILIAFQGQCATDLNPNIQTAELLVSFLLFFSLMSRIFPMVLGSEGRWKNFSGIFISVSVVQMLGSMSNGTMGMMTCAPIVTDPITGTKLNLLRLCEYTSLVYGMAFMTDGLDATNLRTPLRFAYTESFGIIFAFFYMVPNIYVWWFALIMGMIHFIPVFFRLYSKWTRLQKMKIGETVDEVERYDRVRISCRLIATCATCWSVLVLNFFGCWIGHMYFNLSSDLILLGEAVVDLVCKHLYLHNVLEAHYLIFDDKGRTQRRLEELRSKMSAVWSTSSDVLVISVKGVSGRIKTQVSPSIMKLFGGLDSFDSEILLEQDAAELLTKKIPKQEELPETGEPYLGNDLKTILEKFGIKTLMMKAWQTKETEALFQHAFHQQDGKLSTCEVKVTVLSDSSIVAVVRDITERQRRFEAEKKVVSELTARKKDAEANRFTRHEVKNGLLAAIDLCDTVRDTANTAKGPTEPIVRKVDELDLTLTQTLDVVITEVIARDVINGVYLPRPECTDLQNYFDPASWSKDRLFSEGAFTKQEFSYSSQGDFPLLEIDPVLLKYVHRNAVTNARKFGEKGSMVYTDFIFDKISNLLTMKVINSPGPNHDEILELGTRAKDIVFTPGASLHKDLSVVGQSTRTSADGAWIMRNCARTLGGNCDIEFLPDKTIFSFYCRAKVVGRNSTENIDNIDMNSVFPLPSNAWGIGIDDSMVQRKLLKRFFTHLGLDNERIIIKGSNYQEIFSFDKLLIDMITSHPTDLFLVIADENLDVNDDGEQWTVLGSSIVKSTREKLGPFEKNLCALIRSANDSSDEIALYNKCAHGFIPKAPLKKDSALALIAPHWVHRFGEGTQAKTIRRVSISSVQSDASADFRVDLSRDLGRIDNLMACAEEGNNWPKAKQYLHAFKGDLMTHCAKAMSHDAIDIIDMIRNTEVLDDYVIYQWRKLHDIIDDLLLSI